MGPRVAAVRLDATILDLTPFHVCVLTNRVRLPYLLAWPRYRKVNLTPFLGPSAAPLRGSQQTSRRRPRRRPRAARRADPQARRQAVRESVLTPHRISGAVKNEARRKAGFVNSQAAGRDPSVAFGFKERQTSMCIATSQGRRSQWVARNRPPVRPKTSPANRRLSRRTPDLPTGEPK